MKLFSFENEMYGSVYELKYLYISPASDFNIFRVEFYVVEDVRIITKADVVHQL